MTIILSKWLNSYIWSIDGTLTGTTNLGQNGPESNDNEGVLHIPQNSRVTPSPSDSTNTADRMIWQIVTKNFVWRYFGEFSSDQYELHGNQHREGQRLRRISVATLMLISLWMKNQEKKLVSWFYSMLIFAGLFKCQNQSFLSKHLVSSMYLPNSSTKCRMWLNINF